jgi:hypothetical protein
MAFEELGRAHQQTRDSIGSNPDILPTPKIKKETIVVWQEPHIVHNRDINNSWIAGSSTNGIVGAWTGTAGGGQLVVGDTTNTQTLLSVTNHNNTYVNFLRATPNNTSSTVVYGLLDSTSTGTVDTTNFRIDLDTDEFIIWKVYADAAPVSRAKITLSTDSERTNMTFSSGSALTFDITFDTTFGSIAGNTQLELSPDGGDTWYAAENDVFTTFTIPGNELLVRITALDDGVYWKTAKTNGAERPIIITYS